MTKDFKVDGKKTGLNGYIYDFCGDCNTIGISNIWNIHICLIKNHHMI